MQEQRPQHRVPGQLSHQSESVTWEQFIIFKVLKQVSSNHVICDFLHRIAMMVNIGHRVMTTQPGQTRNTSQADESNCAHYRSDSVFSGGQHGHSGQPLTRLQSPLRSSQHQASEILSWLPVTML